MSHEFYDEDIACIVLVEYNAGCNRITLDFVDGVESVLLTKEDLVYMLGKLGEQPTAVNPNEIQSTITRSDVILLAKSAGVTAEELG
jgi:hypothetical protein